MLLGISPYKIYRSSKSQRVDALLNFILKWFSYDLANRVIIFNWIFMQCTYTAQEMQMKLQQEAKCKQTETKKRKKQKKNKS